MFSEENKSSVFSTEIIAYLKDINIYGTVYFSRYFEWQGIAREEYFMTVSNYQSLMQDGTRLITKKAWNDYINHCLVFDKVLICIQNTNIKKFSFEMLFTFYNSSSKEIISKGGQTLVFSDSLGRLIKIPQPILDVILKHQLM